MIPYFGASVYDNPAVFVRSSPITFIKDAKTPTLILEGERDTECPAPQSYEFWHALRTLGVKTQLVIYQGEGHRIGQNGDATLPGVRARGSTNIFIKPSSGKRQCKQSAETYETPLT
jgi:hypothetical protein